MEIGKREREESYRMRGGRGLPSDRVRGHERRINGKRFEFSRIAWREGGVTIRAYVAGTTIIVHEWESPA